MEYCEATLTVWHTKFNKNRLLVLSASTLDALGAYQRLRHQLVSSPSTSAFFVAPRGGRLGYYQFRDTFVELLALAGIPSAPWPRRARIYERLEEGERVGVGSAGLAEWFGRSMPLFVVMSACR